MSFSATVDGLGGDFASGDAQGQAEAVRVGRHGTPGAKLVYALRQFTGLLTADLTAKAYHTLRLSLLLQTPQLHRYVEEFRAHPEGRLLLEDRPRITRAEVGELLKLPPDTFGGAYARFALAYDLDPEFFAVPPDLEGDEAFVQWRTSQTHDVWHTLTGYDTGVLGEVALAAFIAAQRPNLCMALIVLGGACLVASRDPSRLPAIVRGWRRGRRAAPLFPVYWEQLWALPLDEVRQHLGIEVERDPKLAYDLG